MACKVKRGYVITIAAVDGLHGLTGLLSCILLNFMQGVNKTSSSVWRVETVCPLKRDQRLIKLSPTYTHPATTCFHSNYIKYLWTLHLGSCTSENFICISFTLMESLTVAYYSQAYDGDQLLNK